MYPDIVNMYIAGAVIPLLLALALCAAGLYVLFGLVRRKRAEMLQTARDEEAIYAEFREMRLTRGRSKALLERHRQEPRKIRLPVRRTWICSAVKWTRKAAGVSQNP